MTPPPAVAAALAARPVSVDADVAAEWSRLAGRTVAGLMVDLLPWATKTFPRTPISEFRVGAVALGASGALYFGGNFELLGASLTASVHAEGSAVMNALGAGERGIARLAVSAPPCGYCRQFLYEIGDPDLAIALPDGATTLAALLPRAFGPGDLGLRGGLMDARRHELADPGSRDPLVVAAFEAASRCYAPYTSSYAGLALAARDGAVFSGRLLENAAYNPTISPLQGALNALSLSGRDPATIARAVLVETRSTKASQIGLVRDLMRTLCGIEPEVVLVDPLAPPGAGAPTVR